jgi:aspartyl-tRNA(Asn)/glutamyl-tRNA(Gln) amidotransferase subunit A
MSVDYTRSTAAEIGSAIAAGEVSAVDVTQAHLDRIAAVDGAVKAFLHVDTDGALAAAKAVDARRAAGEPLSPLAGVPLAMKDVVVTKGLPTTSGSKILEGWIPPYDATISARIKSAGIVILGKTNMDEFAMGSSTENSAYGPTHNPWDLSRIPGGSSGGSSAAVSSFEAPLSIGTDTGGSIRQPAAVTGIVGHKPTYGSVSRYGLIAFSSSLDQAGPFGRTVLDTALLHEVISAHDPCDSTSIPGSRVDVVAAAKAGAAGDLRGVRVGVVRELGGEGYQAGVLSAFEQATAVLRELGAEIVEVSCPNFEFALAAYYLIAPSECSSNLARFDSVRYGLRVGDDGQHSLEDVMSLTREAGFGAEVKRRIMIGTYALSAGYYDAYYGQAQKVRTLISNDFKAAFERADVLISPTSPFVAFGLGDKVADPMAMYLNDLCTLPASLAGSPAISVPCGLSADAGPQLPVGLQIMAPTLADDRCYRVGAAFETAFTAANGPLLAQAPELELSR